MLDRHQIASASQMLHDHWRAGSKLAALDAWLRPQNRTEGYAIQAAIEKYSTTHLFGWKIAATSEAGLELLPWIREYVASDAFRYRREEDSP